MAGKRFMVFGYDYRDEEGLGLRALRGTFSTVEGYKYEISKGNYSYYEVYDTLKGEEIEI